MDTHNYFEEIGIFPRGAGRVFRAYLIGYALSLALTLIAFVLTILHVFSYDSALSVLVILALIQFGIQAQCFLHLGESSSREKLVIFAGACLVILILVSGSLWIMFTLNGRMMPDEQQMEQYMNDQEGI